MYTSDARDHAQNVLDQIEKKARLARQVLATVRRLEVQYNNLCDADLKGYKFCDRPGCLNTTSDYDSQCISCDRKEAMRNGSMA